MKHDKLIKLILAALFAALTCVATSVIHVPIPATNGYINLGDGMVPGCCSARCAARPRRRRWCPALWAK